MDTKRHVERLVARVSATGDSRRTYPTVYGLNFFVRVRLAARYSLLTEVNTIHNEQLHLNSITYNKHYKYAHLKSVNKSTKESKQELKENVH